MKPICLTIAGIDNCSVAGIYADIKTFYSLDCYGIAAVTTLTIQSIEKVIDIEPVKDKFLGDQLNVLLSTFSIDAIKIGMVYKKEHFKIIKNYIQNTNVPIVLDPILKSTSGTDFIQKKNIHYLVELFPYISLITPNIPEALFLLDYEEYPQTLFDLKDLVYSFYKKYLVPVLLKGGHFENYFIYDIYFDGNIFIIHKSKRINKKQIRGTGCTLSSAITSYLAKKFSMEKAIYNAKKYMIKQIQNAVPYKPHSEYYILSHFKN